MKTAAQLEESRERFQEVFWQKRRGDRPPIGVINTEMLLPINYLRQEFPRPVLTPADLTPVLAFTDYEFAFTQPAVTCDDFMPFSAAWRAIPWLEAVCGCPVRYSAGSLVPGHWVKRLADLADIPLPANRAWMDLLARETSRLAASAPADCWISPTILRGPADVVAAMRGLVEFYCDLHDDPAAIGAAAARVNKLLLEALDLHYCRVGPKMGGYVHVFGYWAPGKTIVIQQDVLGACSPAVYRNHFLALDAEVVRHMGDHVIFHFHSTGYRHLRDVLLIPGLAGLEMNVEANGPPLVEMAKELRQVLEQTRLILFVDSGFDQLPEVLRKWPHEGLYLLLRNDQIRSNEEFERFVGMIKSDK
jgi:hypothetical protein